MKIKILSLIALVAIIFSACKKEEETITKSDIIGKWEIVNPVPEPSEGEDCVNFKEYLIIEDSQIYGISSCDGTETEEEFKYSYEFDGEIIKVNIVFLRVDMEILEISDTEMKVKETTTFFDEETTEDDVETVTYKKVK